MLWQRLLHPAGGGAGLLAEDAAVASILPGQTFDGGGALPAAVIEIGEQLVLGVRAIGEGPEGIGAGADGVFEHVEGCAELRPED